MKKAINFLLDTGIVTWVILVLLWAYASTFYTSDFMPNPIETVKGAQEIILDGTLFSFMGISFLRVLRGWSLGILVSVPLGLLIGRSSIAKKLFEPFVDFFRFVPAIALVTLFIMWFGVGEESKTILIMYATCFTVIVNTVAGVMAVEPHRIQAARALGANEFQILYSVIIPSVVPNIFTGIRLGMGSAYVAIVGAEQLSAKSGIGYLIYTSRLYFRVDWIFVGIVALGLMGFLSDKILRIFGSHVLKRYGVKDNGKFRAE